MAPPRNCWALRVGDGLVHLFTEQFIRSFRSDLFDGVGDGSTLRLMDLKYIAYISVFTFGNYEKRLAISTQEETKNGLRGLKGTAVNIILVSIMCFNVFYYLMKHFKLKNDRQFRGFGMRYWFCTVCSVLKCGCKPNLNNTANVMVPQKTIDERIAIANEEGLKLTREELINDLQRDAYETLFKRGLEFYELFATGVSIIYYFFLFLVYNGGIPWNVMITVFLIVILIRFFSASSSRFNISKYAAQLLVGIDDSYMFRIDQSVYI